MAFFMGNEVVSCNKYLTVLHWKTKPLHNAYKSVAKKMLVVYATMQVSAS